MSLIRFRNTDGAPIVVGPNNPLPVAISGETIEVNANVQIPSTIDANITNSAPIAVIGPNSGNGQIGIVRIAQSQFPIPVSITDFGSNKALDVRVEEQPIGVSIAGTPTVNANIVNQPISVKTDTDILQVHLMSVASGAVLRTHVVSGLGIIYGDWYYQTTTLTNTNEFIIDGIEFYPPFGEMEGFVSWTVHAQVKNLPANATLDIAVDARRQWNAEAGPWLTVHETTWNGEPFAFTARHYSMFRFRVRASQVGNPNPTIRIALFGHAFPLIEL